MKPALTYSLLAVGGLVLFSGAYVGFARLRGAPMHELPLFGALFPAPPAPEGDGGEQAVASEHGPTPAAPQAGGEERAGAAPSGADAPRPRVARASLLDAFTLESPLGGSELQGLVDGLHQAQAEADRRLAAVAAREARLEERERALEEQRQELLELRARLDSAGRDSAAQAAGAESEKQTQAQLEERAWRTKAQLFESGEAAELVERLTGYGAEDAARILAALTPKRARELLAAVPAEKWREYAEAYSRRAAAQPPAQD